MVSDKNIQSLHSCLTSPVQIVAGENLFHLGYADDIAFIVEGEGEAQSMLNKLTTLIQSFDMRGLPSECKTIRTQVYVSEEVGSKNYGHTATLRTVDHSPYPVRLNQLNPTKKYPRSESASCAQQHPDIPGLHSSLKAGSNGRQADFIVIGYCGLRFTTKGEMAQVVRATEGFDNLAVSHPSCFLRVAWQLGAERVLQLNSTNCFGEFWNNGTPWLVNFYAPWCGHCRRLSPVYTEVSQTLSEIAPSTRVARLDASSHRDIAKKFQINGFPTLKFSVWTSIVIREPFQCLFGHILLHVRLFFNQVAFYEAAERFRLLTWFLTVVPDVLPERFTALCQVTGPIDERLVVFKDGTCLAYSEPPASDKSTVTEHVSDWILRERYPSFQELHLSSLWEFGEAEIAASKSRIYRLVALFLLPQSYQTDSNSRRLFELGQSLAQQRLKHLSRYRFAWTEAYAALGDLAMVNLSAPSMVVVDPVTQVIYLNPNQSLLGGLFTLEPEVVVSFLLAVSEGRVQ
ncbi:hypothetical protein T265_14428, partial [Opisthorchis viverrini]